MQLLIKMAISLVIIVAASELAKKIPSAAGLIGVMPLTGALVLAWVYIDSAGDARIMEQFARGALWGILPSVLFFAAALVCFKRGMPLGTTLAAGFASWLSAGILHQLLLK